MPQRLSDACPGGHVPQPRGEIIARGDHLPPVRTEHLAHRTLRSCWSGGTTAFPVAASQMCAVPSSAEVTTIRPSGLNAAWWTGPPCESGGVTGSPLAASQTRAVPSQLAVTTRLPSALKSTWPTLRECLRGGVTALPVAGSHTCPEPAVLAVASRRPARSSAM